MPGSIVFRPTRGPVPLDDWRRWWHWVEGACWRRPEGPGSDVYTRARHPVVHVTHGDAAAYAAWAGKVLPTEAEWERAARGGLDGARFAWGDDARPGGRGWRTAGTASSPGDGLRSARRRSGTFPPNGFGLYDMTGNVWEWTDDEHHGTAAGAACCGGAEAGEHIPRRVIKGGSHLCAPSYCLRYRPAAKQFEPIDSSTGHIGFRCALRP